MRSQSHILLLTVLAFLPPFAGTAHAQNPPATAGYVVEYYYKVQWGHFDEFMELYRRNHYPILQREQQMGRILSTSVAYPRNHAGEVSRWDMRFTIVWKDAATAYDGFDSSTIARELYPDQAKFRAEEQRRFELLIEHLDVPVRIESPDDWKR
jgi:hypothetical protein